jgi:hypothetical protein
MTNLKALGPITMNGTKVVLISATVANLTGFTINRINLNASTIGITTVEWFVTAANFAAANGGSALQVSGSQATNIGPIQSATYGAGTMSVVQWNGATAELAGMTTQGQPATSGSEPYIPNILTATQAELNHNYEITGPMTWQANDTVSEIVAGEVTISQFSFVHPITYTLDRTSKIVTYASEWQISATSVTGWNVTAYSIYFDVSAFGGLETVIGVGSDDVHNIIPHGYTSGMEFPITSITVDTVSFSVQQLSLSTFVLSIA